MTSSHGERRKMMSLVVQGVHVYLSERGAGSPILFLHGFPDSAEMWNGVIGSLEGRYRCFAPDLPGLGRSVAPADFTCSLENMAHFVDELVEAAGIPTPLDLVVTDFGATYGLAWCVSQPEKVRRLAIVGGANFSSRYRWHRTAHLLRTPLLGELVMASMSLAAFQKMMHQNAPLLSAEHIRKTYELTAAKPEARRMALKLYRSIGPRDFIGWEDRLQVFSAQHPTLVLWGDQDPFIRPEHAEHFGSAEIEHFAQNGHWLAVESPDVVAQRLAIFFS
jgi:pimeloyl-ACP methyl ester carboxylesterase